MPLYKGRKPKRVKCRFKVGDVVRLASRVRPDLLPASVSKYGKIVSTGVLCSVWVWFFDLPEDELIFLCEGELEAAPGISPPGHYTRIDKSRWTEWNDDLAEVRALDSETPENRHDTDLPDFETLDEVIAQRKQRQQRGRERTRGNNQRHCRKVQSTRKAK